MSGICGIVSFDDSPVDEGLLALMVRACGYRAVHGSATYTVGNVGLGVLVTRTLADRDVEAAPLHDAERGVVLAADVRLDCRTELGPALGLGRPDASVSDAQLLLRAHERWGEGLLSHLIGDFALALWDGRRRSLLLARDAVGSRPFYYARVGPTWLFASDTAAVLEHPGVPRTLDGVAIANFLAMNLRPRERTMFSGVQRVLPGHAILVEQGRARAWRHWTLPETPRNPAPCEGDAAAEFRELLFRVTGDRLTSRSGHVVVALSGGLDSSSLAAVAQRLAMSGQAPVRVSGINFFSSTSAHADERHFVLPLRDELGIEVEFEDLDGDVAQIDEIRADAAYDGPEHLPGPGWRRFYPLVRAGGADVVLTGFGGDSLFDAARWQYLDLIRIGHFRRALPWLIAAKAKQRSLVKLIANRVIEPLLPPAIRVAIDARLARGRFWHPPRWLRGEAADAALREWSLTRSLLQPSGRQKARAYQRIHIEQLAQQEIAIAIHERRAALAGVTHRMPLLDTRLAEFAYATEMSWLASPGRTNTKLLLRNAVAGVLPESVRLRAGKSGWVDVLAAEQHRTLSALGLASLETGHLASLGVVDGPQLSRVCLEEWRGSPYNAHVMAALWLEVWLMSGLASGSGISYFDLLSWQTEQGLGARSRRER